MTPTILYVDHRHEVGLERQRLAGMRRYAATRGWRVETLEYEVCSPAALRKALARLRPVGCLAECWRLTEVLRPALFGKTPVVYFSPPDRPGWSAARGVVCDEAAVARRAFEELSASRPAAYVAVSYFPGKRWALERIAAFRECCRTAGFDCPVFHFTSKERSEWPARFERMVRWAATLPARCAIFAVNDLCAHGVAAALLEAGRPFPRTATIIGADGADPEPPDTGISKFVSSVRLDHEMAGYLAAKMIGDRNAERTAVFPPLLIDRRKSTRGHGRNMPRVIEAMETIRREACDGLTVARLSAHFPGSRRLFEIRFREAAGHSALDEILNVRMARAMELLVTTDTSIAAVASFCGFKTEWEFWDLFKRRTGRSPQRFRMERK